MTSTTDEYGRMNMWAKEPTMYMTKEDMERYGFEPYAERAERANGRWAMIGVASALISYFATGKLFFGVF